MLSRRLFFCLFTCSMFALPSCLFAGPSGIQAQMLSAAGKGNLRLVKQLLAKGAKVNVADGEVTPLMRAAEHGHTSIVAFLLARGASVKATDRPGYLTALLYAKNYGCVKTLLNAGADANSADIDGESVLMYWLGRRDKEAVRVIRLLIARGADVNCGTEAGETGLMRSVEAGNATVVRLLLAKGAQVSGEDDGGETALAKARRNKRADLVALLKQAGANQ